MTTAVLWAHALLVAAPDLQVQLYPVICLKLPCRPRILLLGGLWEMIIVTLLKLLLSVGLKSCEEGIVTFTMTQGPGQGPYTASS